MTARSKHRRNRVASNDGLGDGPRYRRLKSGLWCYEWPGAMFSPGVGRTKAEAKADADADNQEFANYLLAEVCR